MASLIENMAPEYTTAGATAGNYYMHSKLLYLCKKDCSGLFDESNFEQVYLSDLLRGTANSNLGGNGDDFFFALSGTGAYMSIPSGNEFYAVWNGEYTPDSISNISVLEGNLNSKNTLVKCESKGGTCGLQSTSTWAYNTSVCILYNYSNKYKIKKGSSITLDDITDGSTIYIVTVNSDFSGTDILFSTLLASKSSSGNYEYIRIYKAKANKNATISNALAVFY